MRSKLTSLVMLLTVVSSLVAGKLELSWQYYVFLIGLSYSELAMVTLYEKLLEVAVEGGD